MEVVMNHSASAPHQRPVVFLDRDGTVIVNRHYLKDPEGVELLPGAAEGLRRMGAVAHLVLVSNQSGIGRGFFTELELNAVSTHLNMLLEQQGVHLVGMYHCPHGPDEGCECRKPGTAMVGRALRDLQAAGHEPGPLCVIGDNLCDVDLALALKALPILVRTGWGKDAEPQLGHRSGQVKVVDDLIAAAELVSLLAGKTCCP